MSVIYKKGDLLNSDCDIVCHQVNCKRVMGSGIAGQIRKRWPIVFEKYCEFIDCFYDMGVAIISKDYLGLTQIIKVGNNKYVANFFSQDEYYPRDRCHTDYDAFRKCCIKLRKFVKNKGFKIGFPYKIGCGLAGGDWSIVSKIIEEELQNYEVEIYEYKE